MKNKSFTLIELAISILITSVGIMGVFTLITSTLSSTSTESSKIMALYLAQEGIEIVRNIRDTNFLEGEIWNNGLSSGYREVDYTMSQDLAVWENRCLNIDSNNLYSYNPGTPTKFRRKITITEVDSEYISVLSEVFWDEKGQTKKIEAKGYLYNWY